MCGKRAAILSGNYMTKAAKITATTTCIRALLVYSSIRSAFGYYSKTSRELLKYSPITYSKTHTKTLLVVISRSSSYITALLLIYIGLRRIFF